MQPARPPIGKSASQALSAMMGKRSLETELVASRIAEIRFSRGATVEPLSRAHNKSEFQKMDLSKGQLQRLETELIKKQGSEIGFSHIFMDGCLGRQAIHQMHIECAS